MHTHCSARCTIVVLTEEKHIEMKRLVFIVWLTRISEAEKTLEVHLEALWRFYCGWGILKSLSEEIRHQESDRIERRLFIINSAGRRMDCISINSNGSIGGIK